MILPPTMTRAVIPLASSRPNTGYINWKRARCSSQRTVFSLKKMRTLDPKITLPMTEALTEALTEAPANPPYTAPSKTSIAISAFFSPAEPISFPSFSALSSASLIKFIPFAVAAALACSHHFFYHSLPPKFFTSRWNRRFLRRFKVLSGADYFELLLDCYLE